MCSDEGRKGIPAGRDSTNKDREADHGQCRREVLGQSELVGEAGELGAAEGF